MANVLVTVIVYAALVLRTLGQQDTNEGRQLTVTTQILTEDSGNITLEEAVTGESRLWVLDGKGKESEGTATSFIDINITQLHLPSFTALQSTQGSSVPVGDFLLIGAGQSILIADADAMFYGVRSAVEKVRTLGPSAHIYLHLNEPSLNIPTRNVSLVIAYDRTVIHTTQPPSTTTPAPPISQSNHSAWIDLNGVPVHEGYKKEYQDGVRKAVAAMLSEHIEDHYNSSITVTEEDVVVLETRTCPWNACASDCVAYNVTCVVRDDGGDVTWASEGDLLTAIFADESLRHHWDTHVPGSVWVCDGEGHLTMTLWLLLGGMIFLVVAVNVVVFTMQNISSKKDMGEQYNKMEEEREEDRKRRRSEATSIFGVYGSVASRKSQRVHFPIPGQEGRNDSDSECDVQELGHVILDDPDSIALANVTKNRTIFPVMATIENHSYNNEAFVDDVDVSKASHTDDSDDSDESKDCVHFQRPAVVKIKPSPRDANTATFNNVEDRRDSSV